MSKSRSDLTTPSTRSEVQSFVDKVRSLPPRGSQGRLLFAMDATASREPTWAAARELQGAMFEEVRHLGGLSVQLCFYRGMNELRALPWHVQPDALMRAMGTVRCAAGHTQIIRVLRHALAEHVKERVAALVFVGDCVEEPLDQLAGSAGELGLKGLPVFVFQEGRDPRAERAFRQVARLSGGAWCPFDASSPDQLRDLLGAVAVYASGGRRALSDFAARRRGLAQQVAKQLGYDPDAR